MLQCAAAGLLVGCGAGAGPGGPAAATGPAPAGSPTPAVVAAGTQTPGSAWRYTLVHTELQRTIPRDGQFGIPIEAEGMWLLAEVQVENAGDRAQIVHGKDFQIRDGKGRIIPADEIGSATYSLRNRFARFGGEFRPGMRAPLGVVFDIDPDAAPLQLYLPQVPGAITLAP
ncbi:MAG TPA: DUF4352 domain-containing protein [Chloroflexota bacterium]